ncbi:hypothetical protein KIN20_034662 [Parelaphostrongylus tenuis]|uniref:Uncharacterized protein n=1 Tax=Parelaphostrongylus tenuis TaxID=148309 RepID=A0AAD5RA25_PARTN|nr:hypothetical protein KIN20_034662 [Parelaphostrongylus tenuis]
MKPQHVKFLPPVLINTLASVFTRYMLLHEHDHERLITYMLSLSTRLRYIPRAFRDALFRPMLLRQHNEKSTGLTTPQNQGTLRKHVLLANWTKSKFPDYQSSTALDAMEFGCGPFVIKHLTFAAKIGLRTP